MVSLGRRYLARRMGIFPKPLAGEVAAATRVIRGSQWNMTSGAGLAHERLEAAFAEYIGGGCAVAVNTGGMALQMSMRALGLKPGDEVLHQVDACSAVPLAVMAASCTPIFTDSSRRTFMLDAASAERWVGPGSRALIATHMWGNPEDMETVLDLAGRYGLIVIEDACLALGASIRGRKVGSFGRVGVFSFGCDKPIQAGEGGMIVTQDEALARELRAMRHWGDRTIEYGVRDTLHPAWNGRMSEIVAAVVYEQLKGYPRHLESLRTAVAEFAGFVSRVDGLELALGNANDPSTCALSQVVVRIDEGLIRRSKADFKQALYNRGIPVWHANYEPVNSLSLFRDQRWKDWLPAADSKRTQTNYEALYPNAQHLYEQGGLGLGKMNFLSRQNLQHLKKQLEDLCLRSAKW